jgi:hypothetical protein
MDYNYIYLTYDALLEFASGRTFQSAEFSQSEQLCDILMRKDKKWSHPKIFIKHIENRGVIFYTHAIDKKRGLLYDLSTFSGFNQQSSESVITIFQKTIKYAIRYFDKQPLAPCEYNLSGDIAIVYPYPFTPPYFCKTARRSKSLKEAAGINPFLYFLTINSGSSIHCW